MRSGCWMLLLLACGGRGCRCNPEPEACADADKVTFYADADGDGHGDPLSPLLDCTAPAGSSTTDDDCDDQNGLHYVSAGAYLDQDGDGFGAGQELEQCAGITGFAGQDGDCDDQEAAVFPAAELLCGDGIGQDVTHHTAK